jgi:hypothetical protein
VQASPSTQPRKISYIDSYLMLLDQFLCELSVFFAVSLVSSLSLVSSTDSMSQKSTPPPLSVAFSIVKLRLNELEAPTCERHPSSHHTTLRARTPSINLTFTNSLQSVRVVKPTACLTRLTENSRQSQIHR